MLFQGKPLVELCCLFVVLLKQIKQVNVIQITVYFHRHNHNCSLKPHLNFHTVVWLLAPCNVFNRVSWKDIRTGQAPGFPRCQVNNTMVTKADFRLRDYMTSFTATVSLVMLKSFWLRLETQC